jgi:iron complex transport system substrate-binding protein
MTIPSPASDGGRCRPLPVLLLLCCIGAATGVLAQSTFVDDANRSVTLPSRASRVFAAGAPAEVLLYTLVPEMLVGRNRVPEGEAAAFFPPAFRTPVFIRQLPEVDNPAADAEFVALKPDVYIDYGTVNADYAAVLDAVHKRTGVPGILLDGSLDKIASSYRRLGTALGVADRGNRLADATERLLATYRGALAKDRPVRVYLACSGDGFQPCLADQATGEQLAWLGGVNVAGTRATAPRRGLTIDEITKMAPDVIVAGGPGAAAKLRSNVAWQSVPAVAAGRVYEWPSLPYSWSARPPSVNRLPGVMWLAYVAAGRSFDAAFDDGIRAFYKDFYHLELSDTQLRRLLGS